MKKYNVFISFRNLTTDVIYEGAEYDMTINEVIAVIQATLENGFIHDLEIEIKEGN